MKKYGTIILALIAVAAIVVSCVFGVQKGNLQKDSDALKADLEAKISAGQKDLEGVKADLEGVKAELETAKADLEGTKAELETANAGMESAKTELDTTKAEFEGKVKELETAGSELETKKAELEAKVAELEGKLLKTERALTAAQSNAYIMYANSDWSVQNWGTADSEDEKVKVTPAAVTGPGDYTVGLEFAEPAQGIAFTALGLKNGEIDFPGYYLRVNEIRINGEKIDFLEEKVGYTSSDDQKETRVNIYNEWVSALPDDARVWNGDKAHAAPVFVDKEKFASVSSVEVDFSVFDGPTDYAYIMYANADWSKSNWGITDAEGVKVTAPEIRGAGDYTTSIEFAEPAEGIAFTALGVVNGEVSFPGWYLTVKEIRINGEKIDFLADKKPYTSSDEGITTRSNLYNEWVTDIPDDARSLDGSLENAAAIVVDKEAFASVSKMEVDFNYSPISAYIMYANADWSVSNWGYTSSDTVKVTPAALTGEGAYTTSIEFAEPCEGLAFTALGIKNGEDVLPGWIIEITKITLNDGDNILNGIPYTSSDDKHETRSNIFNEWVTDIPDDARNASGNLENASTTVVEKDLFTGVTKMTVEFNLIKGKEAAAVPAEAGLTKEQIDEMKANGFNAYIGVQSASYIFRNTWDEANYGRDSQDNPECFGQLTGWDADNNKVNYGGTFEDVLIKGDGEYTVSLTTGEMGFGSDETLRMLFVSTEIPSQLVKDGYLKIDDVRTKIGDAATQKYTDVDAEGDYVRIIIIDEYNRGDAPFGYTVPGADAKISITFTVSGW